MSGPEVLAGLDTTPAGLSPEQVRERLGEFGPNELAPPKKISPARIFLRQFENFLILILIVATGISFALGETLDAWVILGILLACILLGFIQEYRAEQAARALQKLAAPEATVLRQGQEQLIPARDLVPGDILILHTGDRVAADGRVLEQFNLRCDEATLTGESVPVDKMAEAAAHAELALADQKGMVFGGTVVTYGRGRAVVTATGMQTEFGRIARLLGEVKEEKTPLEVRMATIGHVLSVICLLVAAGAMLLGVLRGYGWLQMLIWGISLAVAAVPEALPAVVTGALAIGTTRMARRNAIVKRLPAVETMGCTTVICTDKTGTLTRNEMTVKELFLEGRVFEVTGQGYAPRGEFLAEGRPVEAGGHLVLSGARKIAYLCNDAVLEGGEGGWRLRGDPTEGALLTMARKGDGAWEEWVRECPRVAEIPFEADRKRMATIHRMGGGLWVAVKGAPESLLARCTRILTVEGDRPLTEAEREEILQRSENMAGRALRVLGLACRGLAARPELTPEAVETDLTWVGLAGLMDPLRDEARAAVARCREAGIRVIMVTGDHPDTACAIAREAGLMAPGREDCPHFTGPEMNRLSDTELTQALRQTSVFARVSPEHKLRLVHLLKAQGEVVAMTGDGVNDAPALKRADIGVAMGLTGTEVTKETAAMILADDNFATLVAAVEEGRVIFDNIKKYLIFLLSCNIAEILVLTGAFFLGLPLPLIALQILWVNLTTDGLPALALGVDPKAPDIMSRPPRPAGEGVFTRPVNWLLGVVAGYLTLILIPLFAYYYHYNPGGLTQPDLVLERAQTMVLVTIIMAEMVMAFNCRSDIHSLFTVGFWGNRFLVISVIISLIMMWAVVQVEPLAKLFHTDPLGWQDWLLAAFLSLLLFPIVEAVKWRLRLTSKERISLE